MNSINNGRLSNLLSSAIEKQMFKELGADSTFIDEVINLFAETKNRKID
jgi:hypothetical protein